MWRFISILSVSVVAYGFLLDKDPQQAQGQAQYLSVSTYLTDQTHINHEFEKLRREQELTINLLTKQLQQRFTEMQSQISQQSAVNESYLTNTAALEQRYLELEENNTRLSDSLKSLQLKYDSLISALANKTSELKDSLQDLKQLKNIQQLQTVDDLQKKILTIDSLVNSLRSNEQARNQDFLALYNLTTHSQTLIRETNTKMSDRFDNVTIQSKMIISDFEKRTVSMDQFHALEGRIYDKLQNVSFATRKQQVALSACVVSTSTIDTVTTVKFQNINTREGIDNHNLASFRSSGVFVCDVPGIYHISAIIYSTTNKAYFLMLKNNKKLVGGHSNNYDSAHGEMYITYTAIAVTELQKADTISIKPGNINIVVAYDFSCLTIVKVE